MCPETAMTRRDRRIMAAGHLNIAFSTPTSTGLNAIAPRH
jgi:hypothetical protein